MSTSINSKEKQKQKQIILNNSELKWLNDLEELKLESKNRFSDIIWITKEFNLIYGNKFILYSRSSGSFQSKYLTNSTNSNNSPNHSSTSHSHNNHSTTSLSQSLFQPYNPSITTNSHDFHENGLFALRTPSPSVNGIKSIQSNGVGSSREQVTPTNGEGRASSSTTRNEGDELELVPISIESTDTNTFLGCLDFLYTGSKESQVFAVLFDGFEENIVAESNNNNGTTTTPNTTITRLRQDLLYSWRSKLFADVSLILEDDSRTIFSSHRAILASRSSYFHSLLLGNYSDSKKKEFRLPSPPFTPSSTIFVLGYIYSGTLEFSNRNFDLSTAFDLWQCGNYLNLIELQLEVEFKILEMLNLKRSARIYQFSTNPQVNNQTLITASESYVVNNFGEVWFCSQIGNLNYSIQKNLVEKVCQSITPTTLTSISKSTYSLLKKLEYPPSTPTSSSTTWTQNLTSMLEPITLTLRNHLSSNPSTLKEILNSKDFLELVDGVGFSTDVLEWILELIVGGLKEESVCKVYELVVGEVLLREEGISMDAKVLIEDTKNAIIKYIKRKWNSIRLLNGFENLQNWCLKEISDEIEIPIEDLQPPPPSTISNRSTTSSSAGRTALKLTSKRSGVAVLPSSSNSPVSRTPIRSPTATTSTAASRVVRTPVTSTSTTTPITTNRIVRSTPTTSTPTTTSTAGTTVRSSAARAVTLSNASSSSRQASTPTTAAVRRTVGNSTPSTSTARTPTSIATPTTTTAATTGTESISRRAKTTSITPSINSIRSTTSTTPATLNTTPRSKPPFNSNTSSSTPISRTVKPKSPIIGSVNLSVPFPSTEKQPEKSSIGSSRNGTGSGSGRSESVASNKTSSSSTHTTTNGIAGKGKERIGSNSISSTTTPNSINSPTTTTNNRPSSIKSTRTINGSSSTSAGNRIRLTTDSSTKPSPTTTAGTGRPSSIKSTRSITTVSRGVRAISTTGVVPRVPSLPSASGKVVKSVGIVEKEKVKKEVEEEGTQGGEVFKVPSLANKSKVEPVVVGDEKKDEDKVKELSVGADSSISNSVGDSLPPPTSTPTSNTTTTSTSTTTLNNHSNFQNFLESSSSAGELLLPPRRESDTSSTMRRTYSTRTLPLGLGLGLTNSNSNSSNTSTVTSNSNSLFLQSQSQPQSQSQSQVLPTISPSRIPTTHSQTLFPTFPSPPSPPPSLPSPSSVSSSSNKSQPPPQSQNKTRETKSEAVVIPGTALLSPIPCIVTVSIDEKSVRFKAAVKYLGSLLVDPSSSSPSTISNSNSQNQGQWVGVEVIENGMTDEVLEGLNWNDGSLEGVTYFRLTQPTSTPSKSLSSTVASRANSSIGNYPDSSSNYGNLESSTNSLRPPSSFSTNSSVAGRRGRRSSSTDGRVDAGAGGGEGKRRGLFVRPNQIVYVL